jgi:hypothetical protein
VIETVATLIEILAVLFVLAVGGVGMVLKVKDEHRGWRKHLEAYRYWRGVRNGRAGL